MTAPIPAQAAMAISDATQGFTPFRNSKPAITIASAVTITIAVAPASSQLLITTTSLLLQWPRRAS